jgi:tetratricopeptide (TPR) repeat protein
MSARTLVPARLGLAALLAVSLARGQTSTPPSSSGARTGGETAPDAAAKARVHFQRGRELYQQGAYREAIGELEAAHTLDPHAKDLVFNLAVVNEKLGQIDAAIHYIHVYAEMDLEAQERARADSYLKRLEGAKKEVEARAAVVPVPQEGPTTGPTSPPPEASPSRGRVDAATITAGVFALGGLAFGTTFGIKALHDEPGVFFTGRSISYASALAAQQSAHTEAILADVGFGVGVAAAAIAAYLYFGRTKNPPSAKETTVSFAPVTGGGRGAVLGVAVSF